MRKPLSMLGVIALVVAGPARLPAEPNAAASRNGHAAVLTSSASPSLAGQTVTFTAVITNLPPVAASRTPAGAVIFKDGDTVLGTNTLNNSGVATFSTGALSVGSHSIKVIYLGHPNFGDSVSATLTQTITAPSLKIESLQMLPDGTARITLAGAPRATYSIQATTDLGAAAWSTIGTGTADGTGHGVFVDADSANHPSRFYRATE